MPEAQYFCTFWVLVETIEMSLRSTLVSKEKSHATVCILKTYKYVGPNVVDTLAQAGWSASLRRLVFFFNFASVERINGRTDGRIINRVLGLLSVFLQ